MISQQPAICGAGPLRGDNDAIPKAFDALADFTEEFCLVEGDFRKENDVRSVPSLCRRKAARTRNPASVSAHDLKNENLSGCGTH